MKFIIEIDDDKVDFFLELMKYFDFVKVKSMKEASDDEAKEVS